LSYYKRDANGDATGYFLEATAAMAMDGLNAITADIIIKGVGDVFSIMNSYGITAAFDAGIGSADVSPITVLDALDAQGKVTVRVVGSRMVSDQSEVDDAVTKVEELRGTTAHAKYHYRVLKILDDGTVEGRTAAMFEDYQGEPGNSGATFFTEEQLVKMITEAAGQQIDVHVHALGERAIHEALNAIEAAQKQFPESASRYTLCHIQLITDQDLPRFSQLGVIAQSTPLWASYDTEGEQFVSADQFSRFWRFESLRKSGARLTFGSDFPASGAGTLGLSPLFNMEVGHTRQWVGQSDAPIQPRESERLGIAELIKGYTINGAYQLHMEDDIGSIEVGKKADLVVLDANPFEVDPYSIAGIRVLRTMLDGKTVYEAE
jgi:predicted amidohydrolase YtcJ